jgi:hypothetical protein
VHQAAQMGWRVALHNPDRLKVDLFVVRKAFLFVALSIESSKLRQASYCEKPLPHTPRKTPTGSGERDLLGYWEQPVLNACFHVRRW